MANHLPFLPSVGGVPSVTDFRRMRDAIRASWLLDGKGYKVDRTPQGVRLHINGVTHFIGGSGISSLPGRFDLTISEYQPEEGDERETPTYNFALARQFIRIGGKTYDANLMPITDMEVPCILCLWIYIDGAAPTFEFNTCADLNDLNECEQEQTLYIIPLYSIGEGGVITCDWRTGIDAVMGEFGVVNS